MGIRVNGNPVWSGGTRRTGRALPLLLLILLLSLGRPASSVAQETGRPLQLSREAREAVLFVNQSATALDVVDRVVFHPSDDALILESASFFRRPYRLSDGGAYVQTPPYEGDVFVRQVIENPLADRTLVVLPRSDAGQAAWSARFRALLEVERLNPGRELIVLVDHADGDGRGWSPEAMALVRDRFGSDAALRILVDAVDSEPPIPASIALYGMIESVSYATLDAAGTDSDAVRESDARVEADTTRARSAYLAGADTFVSQVLEGQLIRVAGLVERSIRLAYQRRSDLTNAEIDAVNELQARLARALGHDNLRSLVGDPEDEEITSLLREIDSRLSSDALVVYRLEMERAGDLVTTGLSAILEPALRVYEERISEIVREQSAHAHADSVAVAVKNAATDSLLVAEIPPEDVYRHIELCMEDGRYNLVVFGDLSATGAFHIPTTGELAVRLSEAGLPPRRSEATLESEDVVVHPEFVRGQTAPPPDVEPAVLLERVRLRYEMERVSDREAVVTYRPLGGGGLVSVLLPADAVGRRTVHYLLPGESIVQQARSAQSLAGGSGISDEESAILERWAIVARTAFDM